MLAELVVLAAGLAAAVVVVVVDVAAVVVAAGADVVVLAAGPDTHEVDELASVDAGVSAAALDSSCVEVDSVVAAGSVS